MTSWEVLDFDTVVGLEGSRSQKKTKTANKRLKVRVTACGIALAMLFPVLQVDRVWAKAPMTLGIFSQGLGLEDLNLYDKPAVSYALTYTQGAGLAFQKMEDTLVRVRVDGSTVITQAPMPHLKQILSDASVDLGDRDRAQATIAVSGQGDESMPEIDVTRVRTRVVAESQPIPPSVTRVADAYLPPGQTEVRTAGQPGVLLKKYEVTTENDVDVKRREIGSEVLQKPVPKLVAYGITTNAAERRAVSRSGTGKVLRTVQVVSTAYTHTGDHTASGVWPYVGGVAVDPRVIPIGSKLYIEGYGPSRAVDTGGLIKGNRVDLFFDTEAECQSWGRRPVTVSIME